MKDLDFNIFENEEQKAASLPVLQQLGDSQGWKIIARVLQANLDYFTPQLRERQDFQNLDELYRLQDRISDLETFLNLPAILLAEASSNTPAAEDDPDPYSESSETNPSN